MTDQDPTLKRVRTVRYTTNEPTAGETVLDKDGQKGLFYVEREIEVS